ncbi:polysaccharide deacetylase family protein [Alicyclobacillus mali (ex Roth et al. 2021)]|uniref:polysaccharide deacetylase family protein n=1 Tax=Alicyclobacillus mali (ex Roth et al. 2021) TaxID=1123961 RepID=UPI001A8E7D57|nr:polysaccharide deacetylase family protein [Alicyclobacillus mali (ex Roth et al. 2021)]
MKVKGRLILALALAFMASFGCGKGVKVLAQESNQDQPVDKVWPEDPRNFEVTEQKIARLDISVPILEYHAANDVPGDEATLRKGQLQQEFYWLKTHGFHTINFGQLYAAWYYGYKLPRRPILITFDDGYESFYTDVLPLLQKFRFQATCFIIAGYVHTWIDTKVEFPTMTQAQLEQLQASGLVDIEGHSYSHPNLTYVPSSRLEQEIKGSSEILSKIVKHPIWVFCYPYGAYNSTIIHTVETSGYALATTQNEGYANLAQGPYTLDRIPILRDTSFQEFQEILAPSLQ